MSKLLGPLLGIALMGWTTGCGSSNRSEAAPEEAAAATVTAAADEEMTVELGCAMCIYEQEGVDRCTTAAKVGEDVFLVDSDIDAHSSGLCKAAKNATVSAHLDGDRLIVSSVTFDQ